MNQKGRDHNQETYLARLRQEAPAWALKPIALPGGLVLLDDQLDAAQCRRFLLLLGNRLGPAGLSPIMGVVGDGDHDETETGAADPTGPENAADSCQVTVEERQELFGCFRLEL